MTKFRKCLENSYVNLSVARLDVQEKPFRGMACFDLNPLSAALES
jgi:hypothetical protein